MTKPFREQARDLLAKALGEPEVIRVAGGEIYRWVLRRPHSLNVYVTLDSPELPHLAHIMVSDPSSKAVEPITTVTLRTIEEVNRILDRIRVQWTTHVDASCRESPIHSDDFAG